MSLLKKQLNLPTQKAVKKKHITVPVPKLAFNLGAADSEDNDFEAAVCEMTISGYIRYQSFQQHILNDKKTDENRRTGLLLCAGLLSTMVDPDSGDFIFNEDEKTPLGKLLDDFHNIIDKESLEALLDAYGELNPVKKPKPFDAKKKKS